MDKIAPFLRPAAPGAAASQSCSYLDLVVVQAREEKVLLHEGLCADGAIE